MSQNTKNKKGLFITFEGGDGCGKSTHVKLLADRLHKMGRQTLVPREPGGTPIGEKIRKILLDPANEEMIPQAELLLYEASRAQNTAEVLRPAIAKGKIILCDRFYDSSTAYQGYGRQMDVETIQKINMYATDGLVPDRTLLFLRDADEGIEAASKVGELDRLELAGHDFHERVHQGFLEMAYAEPER